MERNEILNKLNAIAEPATSWMQAAQYRIDNRKTLEYSQEIALRILRELRNQKKSQSDLAKALGVSKQQVNRWVKGSENFTIDTVAKIDAVLGIQILNIFDDSVAEIGMSKIFESELEGIEAVQKEERNYKNPTPIHTLRIVKNEYEECSLTA